MKMTQLFPNCVFPSPWLSLKFYTQPPISTNLVLILYSSAESLCHHTRRWYVILHLQGFIYMAKNIEKKRKKINSILTYPHVLPSSFSFCQNVVSPKFDRHGTPRNPSAPEGYPIISLNVLERGCNPQKATWALAVATHIPGDVTTYMKVCVRSTNLCVTRRLVLHAHLYLYVYSHLDAHLDFSFAIVLRLHHSP